LIKLPKTQSLLHHGKFRGGAFFTAPKCNIVILNGPDSGVLIGKGINTLPILIGIAYVILKYQFEKMSCESVVDRIRKE
jgi:hypothetical protein